MVFPVTFNLFGLPLHAHLVAEVIAYTGGFQLFLRTRKHFPRVQVPFEKLMWVIAGAVFGGLLGSKLLAWLESPGDYWTAFDAGRIDVLMASKSLLASCVKRQQWASPRPN